MQDPFKKIQPQLVASALVMTLSACSESGGDNSPSSDQSTASEPTQTLGAPTSNGVSTDTPAKMDQPSNDTAGTSSISRDFGFDFS